MRTLRDSKHRNSRSAIAPVAHVSHSMIYRPVIRGHYLQNWISSLMAECSAHLGRMALRRAPDLAAPLATTPRVGRDWSHILNTSANTAAFPTTGMRRLKASRLNQAKNICSLGTEQRRLLIDRYRHHLPLPCMMHFVHKATKMCLCCVRVYKLAAGT